VLRIGLSLQPVVPALMVPLDDAALAAALPVGTGVESRLLNVDGRAGGMWPAPRMAQSDSEELRRRSKGLIAESRRRLGATNDQVKSGRERLAQARNLLHVAVLLRALRERRREREKGRP